MRHPLATLLGTGIAAVGLAAALMLAIGGPVPKATEVAGDWRAAPAPAMRVAAAREDRGGFTLVVFDACRPVPGAAIDASAANPTATGNAAILAPARPASLREAPGRDRFVRRFGGRLVPGLRGMTRDAVLRLLRPVGGDAAIGPAIAPVEVVATRRAGLPAFSRG